MDWELIGYIRASKYRKSIMLSLNISNKTPLELANELEFYITHVSSTLRELKEKGLAICLTPSLKKGRIYSLSKIGKEIVREI